MRLLLFLLSLTLAGLAVWAGVGVRALSSTHTATARVGKEEAIRRKSDALPFDGGIGRPGQGHEQNEGGDALFVPRAALLDAPDRLTSTLRCESTDFCLARPMPRRLFRPPRTT